MDWLRTAQSITERNTQDRQTETDITRQQPPVAAVDPGWLDELVGLGLNRPLAQDLLRQYGAERVRAVLDRSRDAGIHNPAGFVRRALAENWVVAAQRVDMRSDDPMRYVRGEYADFIHH